jgi:sulfide:quinone oxidoreductase
MDKVIYITPGFAVTAALAPEDFAEVARLGFKAVVSNRPDREDAGQLTARAEAVHAWRAGLIFRHVPATKHELFTDAVVEGMGDALRALPGPVLAHCKSGLRSAILWAAASARTQPVDCVLAALKAAGFDVEAIRDDLDQQADRARWLGAAPVLDCAEAERLPPRAAVVA